MTHQELRAQVELLLGSAQVESALDTLASHVEQNGPSSVREDVVALRSKYIRIREDYELRGILSRSEYEVQSNKITVGVFALLRQIERKSDPVRVAYWKVLVGLAVAGAIALFLNLWFSTSPVDTATLPSLPERKDTAVPQPINPPLRPSDTAHSRPNPAVTVPLNRLSTDRPAAGLPQPASPQTYTVKVILDSEWWEGDLLVDGQEATIQAGSSQGIRLVEVTQKNSAHVFTIRLRNRTCEQKQKITEDSSTIRFISNCH